MNNINLIGRLTADPELKTTSSGVCVCAFTIAVKRPRVKDKTDFLNCVAWRNTADFISKHFHKGKMIALDGCLTSRVYEDKNGNKHTTYEVIVDNVEFCGDKKQNETEENNSGNAEQHFEEVNENDDLPF